MREVPCHKMLQGMGAKGFHASFASRLAAVATLGPLCPDIAAVCENTFAEEDSRLHQYSPSVAFHGDRGVFKAWTV